MGRLGFGFGALSRAASGVVPPPSFASAVSSDGWSMSVETPQELSFAPVAANRPGYAQDGSATVWAEQLALTKRVRLAYPDQAQLTDHEVALSDYVYADDVLPGVTNNSIEASPKPIAAWTMPSREVVDGSVYWEVLAFHRDARPDPQNGVGKQVACVRVRARNGTQSTAWQAVSDTAISTHCEDPCPVEVHSGHLDISPLPDGLFWLEAEVLPWFGGAASVRRSEDQSAQREFSRRYLLKSAAIAAAPPLVYVASTGNDSTGAVSTDPSTAAASPCLTVGGALARARAVLGANQGSIDGLRIRIVDAVSMGAVPYQATYPQDVGAVIVERAPASTRAEAEIAWSGNIRTYFTSHTAPVTEGSLIFGDVTIDRQGTTIVYGEAGSKLDLQFHNVTIRNNGHAGTLRANTHVSVFGMELTGYAGTLALSTSGEVRIMRGLACDLAGAGPEAWITVGSDLSNANACFVDDPARGAIFYGNRYLSPVANTGPLVFTGKVSGGTIGPLALVQNLVEVTHTATSAASVRLSADDDLGAFAHVVVMHNTATRAGAVGRWNMFYDEHPSVARDHRLLAFKGNLSAQFNTKGDIFQQDSSRMGNFAFSHGVGCGGNFSIYDANAPTSEHQDFAGQGSLIGAGDAGHVDYQGTTLSGGVPVADTGGGDYALTVGAAARDRLAEPVLGFDLAGNARGTGPQAAGAYA